ncbi:MAG: hypothetical protein QOJ91_200 [Sphingomonadales bacterium]|nr:hypothetical protein [Sphingomonadales bacterium]
MSSHENRAKFNVLILAGMRSGTLDPLAQSAGVSHKCLVPVLGRSLIGRVLDTAEKALPDAPIFVSIEGPAALAEEPTVQRLRREGRLTIIGAEPNLVDSVRKASEVADFPLVVTTADNVLVTAEALRAMAAQGSRPGTDAVLAMASKRDIEAAHSGGKGRYYEFRDGGFSNCNLFWLSGPKALRAAEAFREGGQFLKVAGRMQRSFGTLNLILFRLKALTLRQAFGRISQRLGVRITPLVLSDGRLAIDVDDQRSKEMVEELLGAAGA